MKDLQILCVDPHSNNVVPYFLLYHIITLLFLPIDHEYVTPLNKDNQKLIKKLHVHSYRRIQSPNFIIVLQLNVFH